MKKKILALATAAIASVSLSSCLAGPHQLRRTVDDWDHKMYVNNPWVDGVLWFLPVFWLLNFGAQIGDYFVGDAYAFWFHDAWDGKGTGYEHAKVDATDGKVSSLLNDGASWLKVDK
ncbi:MAG: hypothetical protein Fur0037_21700 [Planctomycetota bacterium]